MNRKSIENETLLNKIHTQLFQNKKVVYKQPSYNKQTRVSRNKTKPNQSSSTFMNSQSKSSQKGSKKSDSLENLFAKKPETLINKKKNQINQSQQKLHQSFSYNKGEIHTEQKNITKSMYFNEIPNQKSIEQQDKKQGSSKKNIKINDYFQKYSELLNKCTNISKDYDVNQNKQKIQVSMDGFQDLKIQDVNSLINLIENCVQQANSYIIDLSQKVQELTQQLIEIKRMNKKLEDFNKNSLLIIKQKQQSIQKLKQEKINRKSPSDNKNEDLKNLLKIIEKLNDENASLKLQIQSLKQKDNIQPQSQGKQQIYNQINRKIDILNISIGQTNTENEHIANKSQDQLNNSKKYKFINLKPRN